MEGCNGCGSCTYCSCGHVFKSVPTLPLVGAGSGRSLVRDHVGEHMVRGGAPDTVTAVPFPCGAVCVRATDDTRYQPDPQHPVVRIHSGADREQDAQQEAGLHEEPMTEQIALFCYVLLAVQFSLEIFCAFLNNVVGFVRTVGTCLFCLKFAHLNV